MSQAALLLLTVVLAAPAPEAGQSQSESRFSAMFDAPTSGDQPDRGPVTPTRERPHTLGLGGSVAASTSGVGGAFRYWFGEYVGIDFSAVWSRPQVSASANGTMAQVTPSVLVMLKPAKVGADFDIRSVDTGRLAHSD